MSVQVNPRPLGKNPARASHRIVRSTNGGPIRLILSRGKNHRTGTFISVKADYRAMPWESLKCELGILQMAEVSAGVVSLLAQPHRLELAVTGGISKFEYFPDLELRVDRQFLEELLSGRPIAQVFAIPRNCSIRTSETYLVVVEVKHEDDARNNDPIYQRKLELAKVFYRSRGIHFIVIMRGKDFEQTDIALFEDFTLDRHTTLTDSDFRDLRASFAGSNGVHSYGRLVRDLGGGPAGRARVAALQINRKISIDLRQPLSEDSNVYLMV